MKKQNGRMYAFDYLKAVAIIFVIIDHSRIFGCRQTARLVV